MFSVFKASLEDLREVFRRFTNSARKKAVFYYASSSLVCQFIRFIGVVITTRAIAPDQFGLFAEATLVMSLAGLFREIGQTGALVAYQGKDMRYIFYNFEMNFVLGLGAALLTIGSAMIPKIVPTEVRNIVWLLASIILIEALTLTNTVVLQKRFRFKALGVVDICCLSVWLAILCLLVRRNQGFEVLLYAQLAEGCCRCSLLFLIAGLQFTGFATGKDLQHYYLYQFARPVIPLIIVQNLLGRLDYLLLSGFSTRSELGVYERLGQFTKIPVSLTINLCDKVLMHSYSHAQNDYSTLKRVVGKSMTIMVVGAVLITAAVSCFLLIFLPRLIGSEWAPRIIKLWCFAIPVVLLTPVLANINLFFSGLGMQFQLLKNSALNLLTDLTFGLLLVGGFGAAGVLIAKSISNGLICVYQAWAVRNTLISQRFDAPGRPNPVTDFQ